MCERRTATGRHDDLIPDVLGAKYQLRVQDLREWHVLRITCFACKHEGIVYASWLQRRFKPYERLIEIEHRLRCQQCGNAAMNAWQVYRLPRNA